MNKMSMQPAQKKSRRWLVVGLGLLQILLMGSAFVGGRMLAAQNQRNSRSPFAVQLPSQLPKDPAAATGSVTKIQDTIITLARRGGGGGQPGGSIASTGTEISVTADTKYYKNTSSSGPGQGPNSGLQQVQVEAGTLNDVKVGSNITVWGQKNGERITAEIVYIQSAGR